MEHLIEPDQAILRYRTHRRNLLAFLVINIVFELILYSYLIYHFDYLMTTLAESYREVSPDKLRALFIEGSILDVIVNTWMYTTGFKALTQHKVTVFNHFVWLLLASVFTRILISYLNM